MSGVSKRLVPCLQQLALLAFLLAPCAAQAFQVTAMDDKGRPVQNVAVALYPSAPAAPVAAQQQEVQQKNKLFDPFLTVVQKGSTVEFPNRDRTRHHVYSFSKAKQFDLPLFLGHSKAVLFDQPGVVSIGCNIHDWMLAYIVVVDTPFYVKTGPDGTANINLPDGSYSVRYWYPGMADQDLREAAPRVAAAAGAFRITIPAGSVHLPPEKPAWADDKYE